MSIGDVRKLKTALDVFVKHPCASHSTFILMSSSTLLEFICAYYFWKKGATFFEDLETKKLKGNGKIDYLNRQGYQFGIDVFKRILRYFFGENAIYFLRLPYHSDYAISGYKSTISEVKSLY